MRRIARVGALVALTTASSLAMAESASATLVGDSAPTCRVVSATSSPLLPLRGVPTPVAATRTLVPVWAMVEGGLPVVGGQVHLYSGAGQNRHELALAGKNLRTNEQGSVVVHPRRVPADLTVVVRGGKVDGKRFPGSLRAQKLGYHAPDILTVNPVTTIVAAYQRAHPEMSPRRATGRVKRYLEIPDFHNIAIDLRRSDKYFDGDVLLKRLDGQRMPDLIREAVAVIDRVGRHGSDPFVKGQRKGPGLARAAAPGSGRVLADGEASGEAFVAKQLLSGVLSAAGGDIEGAVLGSVLSEFGLGGGSSDASALAAIQSQLNQMAEQLTELETGVSHIEAELSSDEYKTLVAGMDSDQSLVDGAENCLSYILTMSLGDPDLKVLSKGLVAYINQKLLTVGDDMKTRLLGSGGLIRASYDATLASATDRSNPSFPFFSGDDGEVPRNVADFYAGYQAQLGMFVAEANHVAGLDTATVTANVNSYENDIDDELAQLKEPVPESTVVDTNTGLVWEKEPEYFCEDGSNSGVNLFLVVQDGNYLDTRLPCGLTVPTSIFDFFSGDPQTLQDQSGNDVQLDKYAPPFGIGDGSKFFLRSATYPEIQGLIQDWQGSKESDNPATFLDNAAEIDIEQHLFWAKLDGAPLCGPIEPPFINEVACKVVDLGDTDEDRLNFTKPDATAGIMFVADAPPNSFWY